MTREAQKKCCVSWAADGVDLERADAAELRKAQNGELLQARSRQDSEVLSPCECEKSNDVPNFIHCMCVDAATAAQRAAEDD